METIMTNSLKGKVAVVTGAAAGLGRAIAASLAHEGALVAILGRNADRLQQTAAELGLNVIAVPCDIRNSAQVRRAFSKVTETLGGVDILVNNAAAYTPFCLKMLATKICAQPSTPTSSARRSVSARRCRRCARATAATSLTSHRNRCAIRSRT
jgi:NAD(P)-dependent dehydrogenase (short-subunit alcohol dehydrogenase family)